MRPIAFSFSTQRITGGARVRQQTLQHADRMPSAFFSVSGSAASPDERGRADARRCAEEFLRATHWRPAMTELIGGAMAYTKYGPLLRSIMMQIAKRNARFSTRRGGAESGANDASGSASIRAHRLLPSTSNAM
ncbi:MAG TPA: flavodoxin domain-containing protein [Gemmatimonadaceae bacterium]|jgi:hypothetical protein